MKIAATVILFDPDENVAQRILTYAKDVKKLYIIDNTENNIHSKELLKDILKMSHAHYEHDGVNQGISIRLNQAVKWALQDNYDWLLTMDQDSLFSAHVIPTYFNCIDGFPDKETVAMFGGQYIDENSGNSDCTPKEVRHLITSGSVVNLNLFNEIGAFDEALFIDKVDHEYCLRASLSNYKIIQFDNIFLHHSLGNITLGRSLKSLKLTPRVIHSPVRMYYILRNYLYLRSKYKGKFGDSFDNMKKEIFIRIKNNFLYGKNKSRLLKHLLKGFTDYKKGKMGKLR